VAGLWRNGGVCRLMLAVTVPVSAGGLFEDPNLEKAVRRQVYAKRNNQKPLTREDVRSISTVTGKGLKIKSLRGIEHCRALAQLDLSDNAIEDVAPLAELERLQSLALAGNRIERIEPIAKLRGLQLLDLSNNRVVDVSPLSALKKLNSLYLSNNRIERLSALRELNRLWSLRLGVSLVWGELAVGFEMRWLAALDLSRCDLQDVSFVKGMRRGRMLLLEGNQIKDLAPLVEAVEADEKRVFAPYLNVYLKGNPLSAAATGPQWERVAGAGVRLHR